MTTGCVSKEGKDVLSESESGCPCSAIVFGSEPSKMGTKGEGWECSSGWEGVSFFLDSFSKFESSSAIEDSFNWDGSFGWEGVLGCDGFFVEGGDALVREVSMFVELFEPGMLSSY